MAAKRYPGAVGVAVAAWRVLPPEPVNDGAPLAGWLVFYPIEKLLSRFTDCLVTINAEDYETAVKKLKAHKTVFIQGVGYDDAKFFKHSGDIKQRLRLENGFGSEEILLVYVAELNANKNQALLIRAMKKISARYPQTRLLLVGPDSENGKCLRLARSLGLEQKVIFTGRRDDVDRILPMCDIGVASSLREGLPVDELPSEGRRAVAGLVADGLVDGRAAVQSRVVLTLRGRLLADAVVRALTAF